MVFPRRRGGRAYAWPQGPLYHPPEWKTPVGVGHGPLRGAVPCPAVTAAKAHLDTILPAHLAEGFPVDVGQTSCGKRWRNSFS